MLDLAERTGLLEPIVALLVVANILPILPVVLEVVSGLPREQRRRTTLMALAFGNLIALLFAVGGGALLEAMRSEIDDLRIAGGLILLVFAIYDLLFSREQRKQPLGELIESEASGADARVGVVPLGIPMMVGPATLTTALIVAEAYGLFSLLMAMLVNGLANVVLLLGGQGLMDAIGHGAVRACGKVFGLLLATMAVTMIRTAVLNLWGGA